MLATFEKTNYITIMKTKLLLGIACLACGALFSQTWTNYTDEDGLITGIISNLHIDEDGVLWYVDWSNDTSAGIGNFDGTNFEQLGVPEGATGNRYQGLVQDLDGDYWFGSFINELGLDRFDGANWINYTTANGLGGNNVSDIMVGNDGTVWMTCTGATSGLTQYDGTNFINYPADGTTLPLTALARLDQDSNGVFWMATVDGLVAFDLTSFSLYTTADGLSANRLESVYVDSNNIVWAGADEAVGGGLNRFDGSSFTTYTTTDGLPNSSARAIFEDSQGNLWIGTNMGVSKFDGTNFTNYDESDGLAENHIRAIEEDANGDLWFGTWDGISRFNPTLGIFETSAAIISIHPNPASEVVKIESNTALQSVQVYNYQGAKVLSLNLDVDVFSVSQLKAGVYLVVLTDIYSKTAIKKLLVE